MLFEKFYFSENQKNSIFEKIFTGMITKTQLMEALNDLPEEFSIDTLIQKVKEIIISENKGDEMTEDELDADIEKWYE